MPAAKTYSQDGTEGSSVELNDAVFDVPENVRLVHHVVTALQNNKRQGNAESRVRHEVRGGGAKPFRQKGTGRARQGSSREPKMRGGGVVFGPHKRSYRTEVPLKMRRKALCCALSSRARDGQLSVLESLTLDAPKTRPIADLYGKISPEGQKVLFVTSQNEPHVVTSAKNVSGVTVRTAAEVNALDVLSARQVVVVKEALTHLENRLT